MVTDRLDSQLGGLVIATKRWQAVVDSGKCLIQPVDHGVTHNQNQSIDIELTNDKPIGRMKSRSRSSTATDAGWGLGCRLRGGFLRLKQLKKVHCQLPGMIHQHAQEVHGVLKPWVGLGFVQKPVYPLKLVVSLINHGFELGWNWGVHLWTNPLRLGR